MGWLRAALPLWLELVVPSITHKLFLDDSGTKEYSSDGKYTAGKGCTLYFVFGGILIRPEHAGQLASAMESLKIGTFGRADVEIKANWLRRGEDREKRFLKPYGVAEADLTEFVDNAYRLLCDTDCELVACVVNKPEVQAMYKGRTWYAPAIAYECVMQRVQRAMEECDGYVHVTIDDMDGKSPKGREWKENLKKHHATLRATGSRLRRTMKLDRLLGEEPSFRDSAADDRLQLADLVAYAVYRQFVEYGKEWETGDHNGTLPLYEYLRRICRKFRCDTEGRFQGYGIAKFPMANQVKWSLKRQA